MNATRNLVLTCLAMLLAACAATQRYYLQENLNRLSLGQSKAQVVALFPGELGKGGAPGMQIRAAKRTSSGVLLEVGEVMLTDRVVSRVPYWLMFENGTLVQWGRPEDWKAVAARYEIDFNPSVATP